MNWEEEHFQGLVRWGLWLAAPAQGPGALQEPGCRGGTSKAMGQGRSGRPEVAPGSRAQRGGGLMGVRATCEGVGFGQGAAGLEGWQAGKNVGR